MYQNFSLYMLANHDQNCKVEFIQLCVGFISCQIFFIIQQLDTLYLGVNNVRVVCESMKKFKCVCIGGFSRLDLASDSGLATRQNATCVKHAGNGRVTIAGTLQDKKYNLA